MQTNLQPGDIVFVTAAADKIVRDEKIASRAVIIQKIPDSIWYRVFMSWSDKTKIVDFPAHMLRRVNEK
tara:strand:+ start:281 stop:487 length:207 start_codon:yes stop_codon:yes gene_type:complete